MPVDHEDELPSGIAQGSRRYLHTQACVGVRASHEGKCFGRTQVSQLDQGGGRQGVVLLLAGRDHSFTTNGQRADVVLANLLLESLIELVHLPLPHCERKITLPSRPAVQNTPMRTPADC